MYIILIIGLLLRLSFIVKPEGLWNDEYVSWMIANTPFNDGFWTSVLKQCHMPLYYLYLKPFAMFSDTILRLTSVIPSVVSIYLMYLVGKEHSKRAGIYCASIVSLLSFLIYYSQEVRFYSLLFLFSSLFLLFTIRLIKKNTNKNIILWLISASLVVFTHVLGIIFVSLMFFYLIFKKFELIKKMIIPLSIISIIVSVLGFFIINQAPSSQWWGHFSYTNILFLFTDFFSPVLTNNINAPAVFFYNVKLAFWLVVPTTIAICGLYIGSKQHKGILAVSFGYVLILSLFAVTGKLVFITKYLIEILPIFVYIIACGFEKIGNKGLVFLCFFLSFHIAYIFNPNYVTKLPRSEGNRIVGEIIKMNNPDTVLFTYYDSDRFKRYVDTNNYKTLSINKSNRFVYLNNPYSILESVKSGEKVSIVFLDSVSFFPEIYLKMYDTTKLPEMFVTFSKIKNELVKNINDDYKNFKVDTLGSWTVITAIKK